MHIADVPVKAVFALDFVWAHGTGELGLDPALVPLVLDESSPARVASIAASADVGLLLDERRHTWGPCRAPTVACIANNESTSHVLETCPNGTYVVSQYCYGLVGWRQAEVERTLQHLLKRRPQPRRPGAGTDGCPTDRVQVSRQLTKRRPPLQRPDSRPKKRGLEKNQ